MNLRTRTGMTVIRLLLLLPLLRLCSFTLHAQEQEPPNINLFTACQTSGKKTFKVTINVSKPTTVTVDWGDKTGAETHRVSPSAAGTMLQWSFATNTPQHEIRIYSPDITELKLSQSGYIGYSGELTYIDVSRAPELKVLVAQYKNDIPSLDLSRNIKLEYLDLSGSKLKSVNLPDTDCALREIHLASNEIRTIDLSHCPDLEVFHMSENKLAELNFSGNKKLKRINFNLNGTERVSGLKDLPLLTRLECEKNFLGYGHLPPAKNITDYKYNQYWLEIQKDKVKNLTVDLREHYLARGFSDKDETTDFIWRYLDDRSEVPADKVTGKDGLFGFDRSIIPEGKERVTVYASMYNAAFPNMHAKGFISSTVDLKAYEEILPPPPGTPSLSFSSASTKPVTFRVKAAVGTKLWVEAGEGNYVLGDSVGSPDSEWKCLTFTPASSGNTIYGAAAAIDCSGAELTALNAGAADKLIELYCYDNRLDACELDKLYESLPERDPGDGAAIYIKNRELTNPGAATSKTNIAFYNEWPVYDYNSGDRAEYTGDGTGCTDNPAAPPEGTPYISLQVVPKQEITVSLRRKPKTGIAWIDLGENNYRQVSADTLWTENIRVVPSSDILRIYGDFTDLDCGKNGSHLTGIDLSAYKGLTTLYCQENALAEIDLSSAKELTSLDCSKNFLTRVNLSGCARIRSLALSNNRLREIDLSGIAALEDLYVSHNDLEELDLRNNLALLFLGCSYNKLNKLDVSNNLFLTRLSCYDNLMDVCAQNDMYKSLQSRRVDDKARIYIANGSLANPGYLTSETSIASNKNWRVFDYNNGSSKEIAGDGSGCKDESIGTLIPVDGISWRVDGDILTLRLPDMAHLPVRVYDLSGRLTGVGIGSELYCFRLSAQSCLLRIGSRTIKISSK